MKTLFSSGGAIVKKITRQSFLLLLLAVIGFASCSKGGNEEECKTCKPMAADKVLTIKLGNVEKAFDLWKNDGRNNKNDYCITDAKSTTPSADLAGILATLNLNNLVNVSPGNLVGLAFFVEKNLSTTNLYQLSLPDLKGFFVYYENGNKLNVKVYKAGGSTFTEIAELASETDYITSNNLEEFSNLLFTNGAHAISSILISDNSKLIDREGSKDQFTYKLYKYITKGVVHKPTGGFENMEHHNGGRCGAPCLPGGSLSCEKRPLWSCKGLIDCPKVALQPWNSYGDGEDPRDPVLTNFRDNFMGESQIGLHFVEDFYYIGSIIKDNLNADIAAQSFAIIDSKVIPIINKLMNSPQSTDIIYDNTTKEALIAYVDNVSTLSNDPMFQDIIGEVKYNIEYASGKTVKAVYDELMAK